MDLNKISGTWLQRGIGTAPWTGPGVTLPITLAGADNGFMVHRVAATYSFHVMTELADRTLIQYQVSASIGVNRPADTGSNMDFGKNYWTDVMGWAPERSAAPGTGTGLSNRGFVRLHRQEDHSYYAGPNESIWIVMDLVPYFIPEEDVSIWQGITASAYVTAL